MTGSNTQSKNMVVPPRYATICKSFWNSTAAGRVGNDDERSSEKTQRRAATFVPRLTNKLEYAAILDLI
jgi:hypothetical protein